MIQKTKPDKAGACPIYIEVSINPKEGKKDIKRIPTGEKVPVRYWSKKQEVMSSFSGYKDVNNAILKRKIEVQQIIREHPEATPLEIRNLADRKLKVAPKTFMEHYTDFITFKKERLTLNGMKALVGLNNLLRSYEKSGNPLSLKYLGQKFYDSFYSFAISQGNHPNTINKRFQSLRTFLNHLTDREFNTNLDFKKWKLPKIIPTKIITLSYDELTRVFKLELTNQKLVKVRDLFIILCSTGLRFTDAIKIRPHSLKNDSILIRADKTQEIVTIPLNDFSRAILNKYSNDLTPLAISNQKFNDYLKEVCKVAGLNNTVSVTDRTMNLRETIKEKWQAVSSHTGRRTFITLGLELGMRQDVLMSITGHTDGRSFRKYIDHTNRIKASEMNKWNIK